MGKRHGEQLDALGVNWFYTWGASYPACRPTQDGGGVRSKAVEKVRSELPLYGAAELLLFNEPDHPGQSAMSVASAIHHWLALEASGLRLGSPSPVQAHGDRLKEFMDRAASRDLRVDFITMHSYASPNSESFLENVQELYDRSGKPIWITEYAVAD